MTLFLFFYGISQLHNIGQLFYTQLSYLLDGDSNLLSNDS